MSDTPTNRRATALRIPKRIDDALGKIDDVLGKLTVTSEVTNTQLDTLARNMSLLIEQVAKLATASTTHDSNIQYLQSQYTQLQNDVNTIKNREFSAQQQRSNAATQQTWNLGTTLSSTLISIIMTVITVLLYHAIAH